MANVNNWDVFTLGGITWDGTYVHGINDQSMDPGITMFRHRSTGRIHYIQAGVLTHAPTITFQTPQIKTVVDILDAGIADAYCKELASPAILYWIYKDDCQRLTSVTQTVNEGLVVLNTLTWSGESDVWQASLTLHASWDGSNNPFVYGTAATPAHNLLEEAFCGGSIRATVSGGALGDKLEGWSAMTIIFAPSVTPKYAQGHEYPGRVVNDVAEPTVEVTFPDLDYMTTYANGLRHTKLELYLRKCDTAAGNSTVARVADATAQHLQFFNFSSVAKLNTVSASDGTDASGTIEWTLEETDSNQFLEYTANVAIP